MPFAVAAIAAAGIGAAGSIIAGSEAESGAKKAASTALTEQQLEIKQEAPYTALGQAAIPSLEEGLGIGPGAGTPGYGSLIKSPSVQQYQQSPGYEFQLNQGIGAIENSASATGGIRGGNTLKSLQAYGTGLANQDYNQWYTNQLATQAQQYGMLANTVNTGANAASNVGSNAINTGQIVGNAQQNAANAGASGIAGAANSVTSGINNYLQLQYLAALSPQGGGINPVNITPDVYGGY
jgi:hypothetical protein